MGVFKNEKNGTWYVQFRYTDWQGLRQQKLKRGFSTKREAQEWERAFLTEKKADVTMPFKTFTELYEKDVRPKLKENTWLTKEHIIKTKILPYFEHKRLCDISAKDVIAWQNEIRKMTNSSGELLSQGYLKTIHNQLSSLFNHAIKIYGLRLNPASTVGNMGKEERKEMSYWTVEEYSKFSDEMMDKPISYYAFQMLYWIVDDDTIVAGINEELGINVSDMQSARAALEDTRYQRLQHLIDTKFTDDKILSLLDCFETRNDDEIRSMVTDNADVPTIFEYVLGILWYKASERHGKILDYMKLSLDADLLPKTHAAGGEADIVYEYEATEYYPEHTLLLEATLADSTNQRRMEMEPVSRHLGMHLIRSGNMNSYCVFATNYLNINVISDFRSRKTTPFYDPQDYSKSVAGMKIIPLQTSELKKIVSNGKTYKELYPLFEAAFNSTLLPHEWYESCINERM